MLAKGKTLLSRFREMDCTRQKPADFDPTVLGNFNKFLSYMEKMFRP